MKGLKLVAIYLLILFGTTPSWGQTDSISTLQDNPLRVKADSLFKALNYNKAISLYQELLKQFPRDAEIKYQLGKCYLFGTRNMIPAIQYLKEASLAEIETKVYFYLAEALRYSYQFEDAIDYYRRYVVSGGSPDMNLDEIEKLVTLCENGNFLTKYIYTPTVYDNEISSTQNFLNYYIPLLERGSFVPIPENLRTSTDKQKEYKAKMFYPNELKPGDYIYYTSYGKSTSWGTDIFRIQLLENGKWSKPENLGDVINSSLDEEYPFIMPDGLTLYFASKGHYGMGGYDIYKSIYNPESKQWSTPENLGFPINSPFDDFLFIITANDTLACFTSNRNHISDTLSVILLKNEPNPTRRTPKEYTELIQISKLKPNVERVEKQTTPKKGKDKPQNQKKTTISHKPASFNSVENDPEYSRALAKGFAAQKLADSLKIKLEALRSRFDYVTTAEQRIRLEKKVTKVEDDMLAAQKEADLQFALASKIEQEYLTGKRKPNNSSNVSFVADNPDFIYQAQFASTVFRSDEIKKLADAEKLRSAIKKLREQAIDKRNNYNKCLVVNNGNNTACNAIYQQYILTAKSYSSLFEKYFSKKYKIYSDCIEVARIKSGNTDSEVRAIIRKAQNNFRTADAIINNISAEGKSESIFEASLLRDLGLFQLDLAYAKIWRLKLMEQKMLSNVLKLENEIFGHTSYNPVATKENNKEENIETPTSPNTPQLTKEEKQVLITPIISIIDEVPADFGITDKKVYTDENPIPINQPLPNGVIYRIQIGAFSKPQNPTFFKGMVPVFGIQTGKIIRYYIGNLTRYKDAENALSQIKQKGFKDAFIVAWYNGTRVTTQRAQQLEGKVFSTNNIENDENRLYIVEVGRYEKPLSQNEINTIRNLSQGKELSRKTDTNGHLIYFIGNFDNIEEATRVKDNLIASGLLKAVVVDITQ